MKKVVVGIFVILAVTIGAGVILHSLEQLYPGSENNPPIRERKSLPQAEKKSVETQALPEQPASTYSQATDLAIDDSNYSMHGALLAYSVKTGHYPEPTKVGWDDFVSQMRNKDGLISPVTKQIYVFTVSDPGPGEIQYHSPASCDRSYKDFVSTNTPKTYAFRLRFSGGDIRCFATI